MSKRVPSQYHLTLHSLPTYKGLPLIKCESGFVREYLEKLHRVVTYAAQSNSKFFAVRVDLHFPQYYSSIEEKPFSNECIRNFIKGLRKRLQDYKTDKRLAGKRVNSVGFSYVWAREYGLRSSKPHFHLLLLFNGHTFNTLGHFSNTQESLYNRIGESWGEALGIHVAEGSKFTHFPQTGQYLVDSRDLSQVTQVFRRASYLAKVASKGFKDGFHAFGASRP